MNRYLFTKTVGHLLLRLAVVLISVNCAAAVTFKATDVSLSAVQAAVNLASAGDTVSVPAGTSIWTNTLNINADISLMGAGQGVTIITNNVSRSVNSGQMLAWVTSTGGLCRLSGFSFIGGAVDATHANSSRNFYFGGNCHSFRIDHCDVIGLNQNYVIEMFGWIYGVIDHCNFQLVAGAFLVHHDGYGGQSYGDGSWADSDQWGTTNALYFEDNYIAQMNNSYYSGFLDALDGARIVIRYNYLTNSTISTHGTESGGRERSIRWMEIYENQFLSSPQQASIGYPWQQGIYIRGGTATVWSNNFIGGFKYMIKSSLYRIYPNNFTAWNNITGANPWDSNNPTLFDSGNCSLAIYNSGTSSLTDTNKSWIANQWAGSFVYDVTQNLGSYITGNSTNTLNFNNYNPYGPSFVINAGDSYEIHQVYAGLDAPGYGQGDLISGNSPLNTTTGTAVWPHEVLNPIYEWGNNWAYPPVDQTGYPGQKLASDAPNNLANNFAPDTVRPGYVPLTYPHPLIQFMANVSPILSPPSGLSVYQH